MVLVLGIHPSVDDGACYLVWKFRYVIFTMEAISSFPKCIQESVSVVFFEKISGGIFHCYCYVHLIFYLSRSKDGRSCRMELVVGYDSIIFVSGDSFVDSSDFDAKQKRVDLERFLVDIPVSLLGYHLGYGGFQNISQHKCRLVSALLALVDVGYLCPCLLHLFMHGISLEEIRMAHHNHLLFVFDLLGCISKLNVC